jgi:hypothetical protein
MDETWWQKLSPELITAYNQPCVQLVAEMNLSANQTRKLFNVQSCHP